MICPKCGGNRQHVIDSRQTSDINGTRRRRKCLDCGYRFTSYEVARSDLVQMARGILEEELYVSILTALNESEMHMHTCIDDAIKEVFKRNSEKNAKNPKYEWSPKGL